VLAAVERSAEAGSWESTDVLEPAL
jgi:hypothetical protein